MAGRGCGGWLPTMNTLVALGSVSAYLAKRRGPGIPPAGVGCASLMSTGGMLL